jgi:hypothetical protein
MPVLIVIIIIDLVAILGVLYWGSKHDAHHTSGLDAASSPSVQAVLAKNEALARIAQQAVVAVTGSGNGETATQAALPDDAEKARKREEALKRKAARQAQRTTDQ